MTKVFAGKQANKIGEIPAIVLNNPKNASNIAAIIRSASCYGVSQVIYTGNRFALEPGHRLPREERMKGYKDVTLIQNDYPFDLFTDAVPVAIEVRKDSESLVDFEHPDNAIYVFGPEDGSISSSLLTHCHRFVVIPTRHCLNLATAVSTILWDRKYKRLMSGRQEEIHTPGEYEQRGLPEEQY